MCTFDATSGTLVSGSGCGSTSFGTQADDPGLQCFTIVRLRFLTRLIGQCPTVLADDQSVVPLRASWATTKNFQSESGRPSCVVALQRGSLAQDLLPVRDGRRHDLLRVLEQHGRRPLRRHVLLGPDRDALDRHLALLRQRDRLGLSVRVDANVHGERVCSCTGSPVRYAENMGRSTEGHGRALNATSRHRDRRLHR